MKEIFKLYPPYNVAVGDDSIALYLNAFGSFLIGMSFVIIGIICIVKADSPDKGKHRKHLAKMFGIFILTCGLSRFVELLSLWYNYACINGILKICTGIVSCITLCYVPKVINEIKHSASMDSVKHQLEETSEKIEQLKQYQRGNE
jgi:hypothetical protein